MVSAKMVGARMRSDNPLIDGRSEFRVYFSQQKQANRLGKPYKPLPESSGQRH